MPRVYGKHSYHWLSWYLKLLWVGRFWKGEFLSVFDESSAGDLTVT